MQDAWKTFCHVLIGQMLTKDQILVLREQNELTCTKCPPYCLESCDALQTSPSHSLWPNIVLPPTALMVSLGIYRVRLPLPGGREVPGSLSVLSPFLQFSNLEFLDPYLDTQPKPQWTQVLRNSKLNNLGSPL